MVSNKWSSGAVRRWLSLAITWRTTSARRSAYPAPPRRPLPSCTISTAPGLGFEVSAPPEAGVVLVSSPPPPLGSAPSPCSLAATASCHNKVRPVGPSSWFPCSVPLPGGAHWKAPALGAGTPAVHRAPQGPAERRRHALTQSGGGQHMPLQGPTQGLQHRGQPGSYSAGEVPQEPPWAWPWLALVSGCSRAGGVLSLGGPYLHCVGVAGVPPLAHCEHCGALEQGLAGRMAPPRRSKISAPSSLPHPQPQPGPHWNPQR